MKVETDLRAGGVLDDATAEITKLTNDINAFFAEADKELLGLVNSANLAAMSAWDSVASSLSQL